MSAACGHYTESTTRANKPYLLKRCLHSSTDAAFTPALSSLRCLSVGSSQRGLRGFLPAPSILGTRHHTMPWLTLQPVAPCWRMGPLVRGGSSAGRGAAAQRSRSRGWRLWQPQRPRSQFFPEAKLSALTVVRDSFSLMRHEIRLISPAIYYSTIPLIFIGVAQCFIAECNSTFFLGYLPFVHHSLNGSVKSPLSFL